MSKLVGMQETSVPQPYLEFFGEEDRKEEILRILFEFPIEAAAVDGPVTIISKNTEGGFNSASGFLFCAFAPDEETFKLICERLAQGQIAGHKEGREIRRISGKMSAETWELGEEK